HGDEHKMSFRQERRFARAPNLEIQTQRLRADVPDIDGDFEQVVQLRRVPEIAFEMRTRQPHVKFVERAPVRQSDGAEHLRLSDLEEAYICAIENNATRIHVAPTDALRNAKLPRLNVGLIH